MGRSRGSAPDQMDLFESRIAGLERFAERFARELERAVARARHEEDIRVAVERQLAIIGETLGVRIEGEHEYTLLRGHVDSVYGSVFIEYKDPSRNASKLGPQLSHPGTAKVVEQIHRRFRDVIKSPGGASTAILGIGCDGRYLVFSRFFDGRITDEVPVEVSRWSVRRLLWAIFNLGTRGYALTPESLAHDFGSESELGQGGVRGFSVALAQHFDEPRVEMFFRQWRILFGEVCGYDVQRPGRRMERLSLHFGVASAQPVELLFAIHTYYALLMKLLAAHVASFFQRIGTSPLEDISRAPSTSSLKLRLQTLEDGGIFRHLGITNFLEGDLFAWYLSGWTDAVEDTIRSMASRLLEYNPASVRDNPAQARDLLKRLYHELFPRQVRHDLGEYYTPDWLAELTLDRAGYDGNPKTRLLDPACGSGTFLVLALARVRQWLEANFERAPKPAQVAEMATRNIIGFDLNPLAVLAARTNFLIQLYDLFDYRGGIEIPVYLCDSVLTPSEYGDPEQRELESKPFAVPTSAKLFFVPRAVASQRDILGTYTNLLGEYARTSSGFGADDFILRCRDEGIEIGLDSEPQHRQLFEDIRRLDQERRNGVWARFLKNAFAPVFLAREPVDIVVGNPPWINWESLPGRMEAEGDSNYRQQIAAVFERYGLFSLSGSAARLGGGKKDLAMLFVYSCVDHFLRDGGVLSFVITQSVFKTQGAGDGFRRFEYTDRRRASGRTYLQVRSVDDLSSFQPFEGATNRTAVFVCRKSNRRSKYPVRYEVWKKSHRGRIGFEAQLAAVLEGTSRQVLAAIPVTDGDLSSPWLTADRHVLSAVRKVIGNSHYSARAGSCTWLNGVFWVRVIRRTAQGVVIENLHNIGKIKVEEFQGSIEPDLLFPLVRGRDVRRWCGSASVEILLPQDPEERMGILEAQMRRRFPRTYAYLKRFETELRARSGFRKYFDEIDAFYSVYNVGPYTMAKWKTVWREQSARMQAAVIGPSDDSRIIVPDHKLMLVEAVEGRREAHYLAALLNSSPAEVVISAYSISTSTSTHVMDHVAIPKFEKSNPIHLELSEVSQKAHQAARQGLRQTVDDCERRIDGLAAKIWHLSDKELKVVRDAAKWTRSEPDRQLLVGQEDLDGD